MNQLAAPPEGGEGEQSRGKEDLQLGGEKVCEVGTRIRPFQQSREWGGWKMDCEQKGVAGIAGPQLKLMVLAIRLEVDAGLGCED